MANIVLHTSESRGITNQCWLHSKHTFSFGNYYNPQRLHFGSIRVLNDDMIAPGMGFGMHPHSNMEIITIVREGEIEHKDNLNNICFGKRNSVQVMSAGTGIFHSEFNHSKTDKLKLLQIWIVPKIQGVKPRFSSRNFNFDKKNELVEFISGKLNGSLWIYQDIQMYFGNYEMNKTLKYKLIKPTENGVYIFLLSGEITVSENKLNSGTGFGISQTSEVEIFVNTETEFILIETPMKIS